jgi:C4-dicarboxylate-specific signal transduction histidine kinase
MIDISRVKEMEQLLRVQDKMTSLGRVAAGIAHEIRNPLSGINIYLNTLEKIYDREENLDKVKGIIGQMQSASRKIESIIKRVMDFSKPSESKLILADINQAIREAIDLSSVTLRKSGIKMESDLAEDMPRCLADPQLIEEVTLNLITNAAEAMKNIQESKKLEIVSRMVDDRIIIAISDSGPGVPINLREKVLDPFYSTKNGSTGIGLSISHRIIRDHRGTLKITESKWGGAEFMIEIPLRSQEEPK